MATSSRRLRHATRAAFGALLVIGTLVPATSSSAAATPTLAVGDGSVVEGGKSSREVLVPVTLSAPATVKTTVRYNVIAGTAAAGTDFAHVAKTTVYLVDMADFAAMNEVYARHFGAHRPARSTVAVAGLPKGARVEIDVVAIR